MALPLPQMPLGNKRSKKRRSFVMVLGILSGDRTASSLTLTLTPLLPRRCNSGAADAAAVEIVLVRRPDGRRREDAAGIGSGRRWVFVLSVVQRHLLVLLLLPTA